MKRGIACLLLLFALRVSAEEAREVSVIGYNDMREALTAVNAAFRVTHPQISFHMVLEGTRTAPDALAQGTSAFAPMGAEFSDEEMARYRAATGSEPLMFRVAHDSLNPQARSAPLAIFVNKSNPLASLTKEQVEHLFAEGALDRWEQLGPTAGPIHAVGLSPETALGLFLRKHGLHNRPLRADLAGFPQSRDVVRAVGQDPLAIGFAAMNQATPEVRVVASFDRTLYIYARQPLDPLVRDYLDLVLSPRGQALIAAGSLGYRPLNDRELAIERAKLDPPAMTCGGADTLQALTERWADSFNDAHPGQWIAVEGATKLSAEGFDLLLAGKIGCVTYVREPFPAEIKAYREKFGEEPLLVPVAGGSYATRGGTHAIAIYVNAANPLSSLTLEQLRSVFGAQAAKNWGQLGLSGEWASRPIHAYGMLRKRGSGNPPGIVNFVQQRVLSGGEFRDDLSEQVDKPGEQSLAAIVHRVAEDPDGIGFSGFGFAEPGVKSLFLAENAASPAYEGTAETVANRLYPLSRTLYLMVHRTLSPPQRAFLMSVLDPPGQRAITEDSEGFLPLTPSQAVDSRQFLDR